MKSVEHFLQPVLTSDEYAVCMRLLCIFGVWPPPSNSGFFSRFIEIPY